MMEMLIVAMILSSVTLRVAGNVAVDGFFAARGKESPRYARAKARSWRPSKPSGAASRYWSQLWEDSWNSALERHNRRRSGDRPDKPRGAARVFWSGVGQDARRAGHRYWNQGWTRLDERRRSRSARVPDGTHVVPGEVVPEPPVPAEPEPVLRDEPDGGTDLQFGTDPTDPTGTRSCPSCGGALVVDGEICAACQYRQKVRNQYRDDQQEPPIPEPGDGTGTDMTEPEHQPNQEGTPTMTATTTEITGLDSAIKFCDDIEQVCSSQVSYHDIHGQKATASASAYRSLVGYIDQGEAMIKAAGITGNTAEQFASAKEQATAAAADMERIAIEHTAAQEKASQAAAAMNAAGKVLAGFKPGQEFYDAQPDAPDREFLTAGR